MFLPEAFLLAALGCALMAAGFLAYVLRSATSALPGDPRSHLISRIQRQLNSPLLKDAAIASRVVDIIVAPLSKENFRLSLTIRGIQPDAADFKEDKTRIRVDVDAEFQLVNISHKSVLLSVDQEIPELNNPIDPERTDAVFVDGIRYDTQNMDPEKETMKFNIRPGSGHAIRIASQYSGVLPYVVAFSQTTPIRSGAEIILSSNVRSSTGIFITGPTNQVRFHDKWGDEESDGWEEEQRLEFTMSIIEPLLPGDAIILTIGS